MIEEPEEMEMGEYYRLKAEESRLKRANNREWSATFLQEKGIAFSSNNAGAHLIVTHGGETVDFWPGTGKYIFRAFHGKRGQAGRGVRGLVALLEKAEKGRKMINGGGRP